MKPPPRYLRAVVFDLDGLLIDSDPLQFRAYRDAFLAHGVHIDEPDWPTWHALGASARAWLEFKRRDDVDPEAVRDMKKALYDRLIESELTLKPGVRQLVEALACDNVRLSVASGSRIESIEASLRRFGLREHFEGLFSATAVPRKKPHPDVYRLAVEALKLDPASTVAIEDSPAGMRAALAAGLRCVVCPDRFIGHHPGDYDGAALLVPSLAALDTVGLDRILSPTR